MATTTAKLTPKEVLERARALIVMNQPFYATLLLNTRTRISEEVPTAAASVNEVIVNPEFYGNLNKEESIGVLLHEVLHMALNHLTRRGNRNIIVQSPSGQVVTLWNIACDIVVNQMLLENNHKLPGGCVVPEDKYKGWSVEQVYEDLEKQVKKSGKNGGKSSGMAGMKAFDQHIEGYTGEEAGDKQGSGSKEKGQGSGPDTRELTETEKKQEQQKWQGAVEAAATAHRLSNKGDLPSSLQKILDEYLNPKIKWDQLLPYLLSTYIPYDYSEVAYDRRLIHQGIYVSDLSDTRAQVAVGIDTSGSISDEDIQQFMSEVLSILNSRNVSSVRVLTCDAEVHEDVTIQTSEDVPTKVSGRGGTSFKPVFKRLEDEKPSLLVYITDGMGDYPEDPGYPVLWVLSQHLDKGNEYYPPFGYVTFLNP